MIRSWGYRLRENAGCVALLLILPVLAYAPSLFQDRLPFAPGGILALPPWEAAAAGDVPGDPLSTWQLSTSWPAYQFINAHRHDLGALFWNPGAGLGQPFLANVQNRCLSPFTLPFYLFGLHTAWALSLWMKLAVAGCAAFYVARRYGFTAGFALAVALIFQWSGPVFRWGVEPMGDIVPWFPLLLLAADRLLIGQFKAWPKLAGIVALMALGGDLRATAMLLGVTLAYMLLRRTRDRHHVHLGPALSGYALGLAVGLGLAAPQLLPYMTLLREGTTAPGAYPWTLPPDALLGIFGTQFHEAVTGARNPLADLMDLGWVPVVLIGVWIAIRRHVEKPIRHRVECLGLAALGCAAVPFIMQDLLGQLPLLRHFNPAHYLVPLALPLALMAAGIAETWLHLNPDECKRVLLRMAAILPVYWGGLALTCILFALGAAAMPWGALGLFAGVLAVLLMLFAVTLLHPNPRTMAAGMAVTLMVLIAWGRIPQLPQTDRDLIFPETRLISTLQSTGARVGGTAGLEAWPLAGNGIPALQARTTITLHRTAAFLEATRTNPLLQRRAGVGALLLQRGDIQGPYATVRPDLNILEVFDSGAVLFRDLSTQPPFRIAHAIRVEEEVAAGLQVDSLPFVEGFAMPPREGPFEDNIKLADLPTTTRIPLAVESNQPGVLILTSAWYPHWEAWVDGKETRVYPVDGVFQGVELIAGSHAVVLRFNPHDFHMGLFVFIGFSIILALGIVQALRPAKRRIFA